MKKLYSILLVFLLAAFLTTAALADEQGFDPSAVSVTAGNSSIMVVLDDSIDAVLQDKHPDISIPCDFTQAKVTDPDGNELPCTLETLDGVKVVTFQVAKAGTYTITAISAATNVSGGDDYTPGAGSGTGGSAASAGETTENADGSVTTTIVDEATGVVTETTVAVDGTTTTVKTDAEGTLIEVSATISEAAAERGEPVRLSLELPAAEDSESAVPIKVELPINVGAITVEIPMKDAGPCTVAILVNDDGTEEILHCARLTDAGLALTLEGSCTVKLVNNARTFSDVPTEHWAADAVAFVTARELFLGTGDGIFDPDMPMTRGMLMTVLARLAGADAYGEDWKEKGIAWAVENGVSDGSTPDANVTREQIVVMLWRMAGSPAPTGGLSGHPDDDIVSDWAVEALAWAVENGIMQGDENGVLNPQGQALRSHVAQFLMNFINHV